MNLREEFLYFLEETGVRYEETGPDSFAFPDANALIRLLPLGEDPSPADGSLPYPVTVYEDYWRRCNQLAKQRILSHIGMFRSIFARKCEVRKLETPLSSAFFDSYHTYGSARSKYRYGLYYDGELVAAASFSAGRPMLRERTVLSYEWVRYASLPDCRVAGGMGRLLESFICDVHPEEVMSYADLEWSDGEVYRKLGFTEAGRRSPVEFYVDTTSWKRISVSKVGNDRTYRDFVADPSRFVKISNMGSLKYLKRII